MTATNDRSGLGTREAKETAVTERGTEQKMPPLARQAWNLIRSLADFVADGCTTVDAEQYRRRLEICDTCERREGNRCAVCGCRLSLKARGRAFRCPLGKWPDT